MPDPFVSIVIPTYQRRDSACACVTALTEARYNDQLEVIVVVDGSNDGTADALRQLHCPFPLRILEQPNAGAAAARNRGAAEARGEIILFLDDDMIADPDLVQEHARMYSGGADAVTGDMPLHPDVPEGFLWKELAMSADWQRELPTTPFDVFTGQLSVRRSVFEALGGFDERYTGEGGYGNEDIDFGVRLVENYSVRHNPRAVSRQLTRVPPRLFMKRAQLLGHSDARFAAKNPSHAPELFRRRGGCQASTRYVWRPLSRIPLVPAVLAAIAVRAAEFGLKTRFRSSSLLARLFSIAYTTNYWSAADKDLRLLQSKQLR